jgi:hypothetical protein
MSLTPVAAVPFIVMLSDLMLMSGLPCSRNDNAMRLSLIPRRLRLGPPALQNAGWADKWCQ